jgi:hypothetical protein
MFCQFKDVWEMIYDSDFTELPPHINSQELFTGLDCISPSDNGKFYRKSWIRI